MAAKQGLNRLLRVRQLEEELSRVELEVAVGDRNRMGEELASVAQRQAAGRRDLVRGIMERDTAGRAGSVIEVEQARRLQLRMEPRLEAAEDEVARQREEFLARKRDRRQVETLVDEQQRIAREAAGRRAQQMLDDWYGRRSQIKNRPTEED
jgi:flagellar biosynthesis chaperone FliJ